jgi:hypothetical protein
MTSPELEQAIGKAFLSEKFSIDMASLKSQ